MDSDITMKTPKIFACLLVSLSILNATAEPAQVPHTFSPNTPAKASEVNSNFNALTQALGKIKQFALYQNGQKIGSSYLLNIIALNSGYLVVPGKEKQSDSVYLASALGNTLYYTSNNCSGNAYIRSKNLDRLDLLGNEKGVVAPIGNQIYSLDLSQTPTSNLYINSFKNGKNGVCTDISAYKVAEQTKCIQQISQRELPAETRVIERPYIAQQCTWQPPPPSCVPNYTTSPPQYCNGSNVCTNVSTHSCQVLASGDEGYAYIYENGQYTDLEPVDLPKGLKYTGILETGYLLVPNNPVITGITTAICTDTKGKSLGCATNAELRRE